MEYAVGEGAVGYITAEVIRAGRGEGLLCAGRNRIAVEIRSSDTEFDLITTDRESLAKRVKTE